MANAYKLGKQRATSKVSRAPWDLTTSRRSFMDNVTLGIQACSEWLEVDDLTWQMPNYYVILSLLDTVFVVILLSGIIHILIGYSAKRLWFGWGKTGCFTCQWECWHCPSRWSPRFWRQTYTQLLRLRPFPWHWQLCFGRISRFLKDTLEISK